MKTKLISLMTALTLIMTISSCGKVDNPGGNADTFTTKGKKLEIIQNRSKVDYMPEPEELEGIIGLVMDQYEAVVYEDKQLYAATFGLGDIFTEENMPEFLSCYSDLEPEHPVKDAVYFDILKLVKRLAWYQKPEELQRLRDETGYFNESWSDILLETASSLDGDSFVNMLEEDLNSSEYLGWRVYYPDNRDSLLSMAKAYDVTLNKIGKNSVFYVYVNDCERIDDGLYLDFNISIFDRGSIFSFKNVRAWEENGKSGVMIKDMGYTYDESAIPSDPQGEEADAPENDEDPQEIADGNAKTAFNSVMEYLADQQVEGMSWADVFERGDFEKAYSEDGLDVSITPEAEGDFMLYSDFYLCDSGTVYIEFEPNGSDHGTLTLKWKDKNGIIGEYSAEDRYTLGQDKEQPVYDPEYYIDENGEELPFRCNVDYCYADDEIREKLGTRDGITLDTGVKELPDSSLGDAVISPAVWVTASSDSGEEIQIDLCFEVNDKYRHAPASRYGKVAEIFSTYQRFTVFRYDEDKKKYTSDFPTNNSDYQSALEENAPHRVHIGALTHTDGTYCLVDADAYLDMLDVPEKEIYVLFRDQAGFMSDEFASDNYVELAAVM